MDFASDNVVGASAPVMEALNEAARAGPQGTYGSDRWTLESKARLQDIFEHELEVLLVPTGTGANALALAALCPPWGGVFCHLYSHVIDDECGAPEFFTAGAKLVGLPGRGGKVEPATLRDSLKRFPRGVLRQVEAAALSLSQATESGTVYSVDEIAALAEIARSAGLGVHMDGARFANALVGLGCTPAEMTWKAGVDVLSFGATKNGALACEALVFFNPEKAGTAAIQRKRSGHTLSKGRMLGAQMAGYLRDDHWLDLARHANAMAERLARGLQRAGARLPWTLQANEVFAILPVAVHDGLQAQGAHYYEWDTETLLPDERPSDDEVFVRLICSFETQASEVDRFVDCAVAAGRAS